MNSNNTIFFSTASTGYIHYSVASLLTIRDHISDATLFILGRSATDDEKKLMLENDIKYIQLDLSDKFTQTWDYPIEAYYIFAGPEIFDRDGFKYSVYIDGDVLCAGDPVKDISEVNAIAGVASAKEGDSAIGIFGDDWPKLKEIYDIADSLEGRDRVQSGVVFFNNQAMSGLGLLDRAYEMFKKCIEEGVPRKGDDSLFSLLQIVFLKTKDIVYLDNTYNYIPHFNDQWRYPIDSLKLFHFTIDKPWKESPYVHSDERLGVFDPYTRAWRDSLLRLANGKDVDDLRQGEVSSSEIPDAIYNSRSQILTRIILRMNPKRIINYINRRRIERLKLSPKKREENNKRSIKTWYWIAWDYYAPGKNMHNFGDVCTVDIVSNIFGFKLIWKDINECEFIGTGSILQVAQRRSGTNNIKVWGSGFIDDTDESTLNNLDFFAVRGELTKSKVGEDVPVGDPGILASLVYPRSDVRTGKVGVILHYADLSLPLAEAIRGDDRFILIDPRSTPGEVVDLMTQCRLILSSSLHGLIFADSYRIPNSWIRPSNNLDGGDYKFRDYYSSIDRPVHVADESKIFDDEYINHLEKRYKPVAVRKIQKRLIKAFPYLS